MRTAFIYRRFSSDEQEKGDSLTRQLRECEQFSAERGWVVAEVLTDRGRSAFKGEHLLPEAELGRFIERFNSGEIPADSMLVVERLDRLSRRPVQEAMAWLHDITSRGLQVAIADRRKVFTANMTFEDFLVTALTWAASNEESTKKSERVSSAKRRLWALAERKEAGWVNLAARPPLWLRRSAALDGWIIEDDRAEVVRNIYQWSADGLGATTIAKRLNQGETEPWGLWRRYDKRWGRTAVRQLLNNPAVEGDFVPKTGMFVGKVIRDFYPRIVEADLVARARGSQAVRKKVVGSRARTGSTNLFAGLTYCGECGKRAFLSSNEKKGRAYAYLRCEGAGDGRRCENTGYYPYAKFEEAALDLCLDLALDDRFFEEKGALRAARNREAELAKAIADKTAQRKRVLLIAASDVADNQAVEVAAELLADIRELNQEIAGVRKDLQLASGRVGAVEHLQRVNEIRESARSADLQVREQARSKLRQALSAIVMRVSIEREPETAEKLFTLVLKGGILAVRINPAGELVAGVADALGRPLWEFLPAQDQETLRPLIDRILAQQVAAKVRKGVD